MRTFPCQFGLTNVWPSPRFKGLGEMDAKELFETTMNPAKRKLLRIDLTDAIEAEEMFTKLMGDEVEPPPVHGRQRPQPA